MTQEIQAVGTKEIILKSGKSIVVKTHITRRESRDIKSVYQSGQKYGIGPDGQPILKEFDISAVEKANDRALEIVVVSFDGRNDDILNRILDLPDGDEPNEIMKIVDDVVGGLKEEKKD